MNDKYKPDTDKSPSPRSDETVARPKTRDETVFGAARQQDPRLQDKANNQLQPDPTRARGQGRSDARQPPHPGGVSRGAPQQERHNTDATRLRNPTPQMRQRSGQTQEQTRVPGSSQRSAQAGGVRAPGSQQKQMLKDRFTLEKVIGLGGMGVVYKATDRLKVEARDREPYVAIKVLSEEFKSHPESFIALQRESRKTQRIAHPNVVKVYDFDRDGDTVFMTMEHMEGVPLDQLIKQYSTTGLPREEVWNIIGGLCSALIYAHAENIVHSDFKPGNIFVTDTGVPKIFDFGIARAVANVDRQSGDQKDKTVFDAGSLGALTPAYASLEMLQGAQPDVRDDVYALGCIAYEMLTGVHPFNRIPADEACKSRLKPRKITSIKKRQWKAIEKALMFRREDRLESVEEFYKLIQPKVRTVSIVMPTILVLLAIAGSTYFIVTRKSVQPEANNIQIDQIEYKIRYDLYQKNINKLLADATFTKEWEGSLWDQVSGMQNLMKNKPDSWLSGTMRYIFGKYIDKYKELLAKPDYQRASEILQNAYRFTDDTRYLDAEKQRLAELLKQRKLHEQELAAQREKAHVVVEQQTKKAAKDNYLFSLALKNVNQQLECQSNLNMREFSVAVDKLRGTDRRRYLKLENDLVSALVACITRVAKNQPERALEDKSYALRIFTDNRQIKSIVIMPRDACNTSLAGLGSRGERAVCRDKIAGYGDGPAMVVIPGNRTIKTFAIGKYEVSVKEINDYCRASNACRKLSASDDSLPAVNINISLVKNYLGWLSRTTKQKYRLPTRKEWMYAATATGAFQDPNRNCALNSRGIEKGGQLVRANTGAQNGWGLVNYLGNAREWVYDKSRNLVAAGGSFNDSMERCTIRSETSQTGSPDSYTGFRLVREVSR